MVQMPSGVSPFPCEGIPEPQFSDIIPAISQIPHFCLKPMDPGKPCELLPSPSCVLYPPHHRVFLGWHIWVVEDKRRKDAASRQYRLHRYQTALTLWKQRLSQRVEADRRYIRQLHQKATDALRHWHKCWQSELCQAWLFWWFIEGLGEEGHWVPGAGIRGQYGVSQALPIQPAVL